MDKTGHNGANSGHNWPITDIPVPKSDTDS